MASVKRVCAHDGCENVLYARNQSGVCREHNHSSACQCPACNHVKTPAPAFNDAKPGPTCAHDGCDVPLHALNKRGVCDLHHHSYSCQCAACAARARTKSAGVAETATKRVIHVPIVGNAQSKIHRAPVSVAREPWHK